MPIVWSRPGAEHVDAPLETGVVRGDEARPDHRIAAAQVSFDPFDLQVRDLVPEHLLGRLREQRRIRRIAARIVGVGGVCAQRQPLIGPS